MRKTVNTGVVILAFPHLDQPSAPKDHPEKKQYSAMLMIPKGDRATVDQLAKDIAEVVPTEGKDESGKVKATWTMPLKDGDKELIKDGGNEGKPKCPGYYYMNVSNANRKPEVVKKVNGVIYSITEEEAYSGCFVVANINLSPYNNSGNKGVAAYLNALIKVRDGERIGGAAVKAEDAFKDIPDTEQSAAEAEGGNNSPLPFDTPGDMPDFGGGGNTFGW